MFDGIVLQVLIKYHYLIFFIETLKLLATGAVLFGRRGNFPRKNFP